MKSAFRPSALAMCLLLAACAGGGSFDVQPVTVVNPEFKEPVATEKDETTPPKVLPQEAEGVMKPALGYSMPIPRRNVSRYDADKKLLPDGKQVEEYLPLNPQDLKALHPTDITAAPHAADLAKRQEGVRIDASNPAQRGYEFVHTGYIFSDFHRSTREESAGLLREGADGYIFYQGRNPAQALPVGKTVNYTGHWEFVSDAKRARDTYCNNTGCHVYGGGGALGFWLGYGDSVGATSFAETATAESPDLGWRGREHVSEFTADFANKKLTGTLKYRPWTRRGESPAELKTRYTIDATIQNNRFSGKATAADKQNPKNLLFKSDSALLEGGFYGGNAQELAGKFLTDDNTLFGVFAAKQHNPTAETEKVMDAYQINRDGDHPVLRQPMPNFGSADKLVLEGKTLSLLPEDGKFLSSREITLDSGRTVKVTVCCANLDYLKFGSVSKSKLAGDDPPKEDDEEEEDEEFDEGEGLDEGEGNDTAENNSSTDNATSSDNNDKDNNTAAGDNSRTDTAANDSSSGDSEDGEDEGEEGDDTPKLVDNPAEDSLAFSGAPYGSFLFIQGERTRSADMPQNGQARYLGTWEGFTNKDLAWRTLPGNGRTDSKADFQVDFGAKTLSGTLTEHNGVRPAFFIDADVKGNGFAGTVRTHSDGVVLDPGREGGSPRLLFGDIPVKGGFYGPKASELGGSFFSDEHKAGAVFGGKRQSTAQ